MLRLTPLGDQHTQKSTFFAPQAAYDSLKMSANAFAGAYICIQRCVLRCQIVAGEEYACCPGLSELAPPAHFAVFAKKSTHKKGDGYGTGGY